MKKDIILIILLIVALILIGHYALKKWTDLPMVYKSNSTKECVKVVLIDEKTGKEVTGSCDKIPEKHILVWVK